VRISSAEKSSGRLEPETIDAVCAQVLDSGFAILEGVLDADELAAVDAEFSSQLTGARSAGGSERIQVSRGAKHYQLQPDLNSVLGSPMVVANELVVPCLERILGEDFRIAYYNSNVAEPGSDHQDVHRDHGPLFGTETDLVTPPFLLAVNIMLCDFSEWNGSTEVWPGTHLLPEGESGGAGSADLEKRSRNVPSVRANAPAGSVVLRDLRLWHRGMPNRSDDVRSMLSLVYKRNWFRWRAHKSLAVSDATYAAWPSVVQQIFKR
jgi:ectoine hydroxylase-related dioxygenase (phytanoyl-CoA dioxygenase family)